MKKLIKLEMYFDDDFMPPEKFDEPTEANRWISRCSCCPFYDWDDETSYGLCIVSPSSNVKTECPIRKFF